VALHAVCGYMFATSSILFRILRLIRGWNSPVCYDDCIDSVVYNVRQTHAQPSICNCESICVLAYSSPTIQNLTCLAQAPIGFGIEFATPTRFFVAVALLTMPETVDLSYHSSQILANTKRFSLGQLGSTVLNHVIPEVEEVVGRSLRKHLLSSSSLDTAYEGFSKSSLGHLRLGHLVDLLSPKSTISDLCVLLSLVTLPLPELWMPVHVKLLVDDELYGADVDDMRPSSRFCSLAR